MARRITAACRLRGGRSGLRRRQSGAACQRSVRAVPGRAEAARIPHALHDGGAARDGSLAIVQADIIGNGGGRANCSVFLVMVGAAAAQSIYYFPKSDLATTAIASRALDAGSARG